MDISPVGYSRFFNVSFVSSSTRTRSTRAAVRLDDSAQIEPIGPRYRDIDERLERYGRIQFALASALRTGEYIERHGLLNRIQ